ncbi:MAG: 5-oxoprolinase subunit PxpA [Gammaproteobacteria bacterium]|nr:5-oxoprolinase subunit PxpA [Gammaproteobacteria bacterium]
MASIDINADLGEGDPFDAELLAIVSSCNIACGGHAGDTQSMRATIEAAIRNDVAIGAHPSYPDPEGLGRRSGFLSGDALYESLTEQVTALADIAAQLGATLSHVKPHGALYNDAVLDRELADVIARVTAEAAGAPSLVGMANTELQFAADRFRLEFVAEAFVDRAYEADGTLVPRSEPGAVHADLSVATTQAVGLAERGRVTARNGDVIDVRADTLCIHGDTPGAAEAARAVRDVLQSHGVEIRAQAMR